MEELNRKSIGRSSNALGHHFEDYIMGGCRQYEAMGRAKFQKTPEPFRVLRKYKDGTATVRFTANAEPDFIGCCDGMLMAFEAKKTQTNKISQNVVTPHQWKALDKYAELGGTTGLCVGIKDETFWLEWYIWKNMKQIYGRKYVTAEDIQPFKVQFNGSILFLDGVDREAWFDELNRINILLKKPLSLYRIIHISHP